MVRKKLEIKKILSYLLVFALLMTGIFIANETEAAKKIRLNKKKATVYVGKTVKLKVKGTKKKVTWKTKNKKVATVSKKGVVKGKKAGKAQIVAKVAKKTLKCQITVKKKRGGKTPGKQGGEASSDNGSTSQNGNGNQNSAGGGSGNAVQPTPDTGKQDNPTPTAKPTPTPTPTPDQTQSFEPVFSKESGEYNEGFSLTLTGEKDSTIYYTTDGSVPLSKEERVKEGSDSSSTEISATTANEEFASTDPNHFQSEDVSDGVKLTFGKRYVSVCFKVPEKDMDWSSYDGLQIKYTVNQIGNSTMDTMGLQICPIYADATSSWNGTDSSPDTTRIWDTSRAISGSGTLDFQFSNDYKERLKTASVGRLMLGASNEYESANQWSGSDVVTIHSIKLIKNGAKNDEIPAKLDTKVYTGPIEVKNRDNEPNQLCSEENIPYMYDPSLEYDGEEYPSSVVPKATVIRAVAVRKDGTKSKVVTKVYFVGNHLSETYKNASVISIVTDPDNLLSKLTGIYRYGNWDNRGEEWERPAEAMYIDEDGKIPFNTTLGIRIHGGYSRKWGQKSFRLYFREEYGMKNLKNYPLIPGAKNFDKTEATTKYKKLILRNGGNDYKYTKLQDVWIQSLVEDRAYTIQSSRPCVLFLNGEYWGLYNLTERYCDNYLETEFDVDKKNVVMVKNGELDEGNDPTYGADGSMTDPGDIKYYDELMALAYLDMSDDTNYKKFTDMVDEQSFLDYYATELYIGNNDWPGNNTQLWRTRENDGSKYGDTKWRYMLFDTEYSMDLYGCDSGMGNVIERTRQNDRLFNAVCNNIGFQQKLADTLMDLANRNFEPVSASAKLDTLAVKYRPLMEQYFARFSGDLGTFDNRIERLKRYVQERKAVIQGFLQDSFGI